jgi:uncharacterized protein GlcG (DUF336 family)
VAPAPAVDNPAELVKPDIPNLPFSQENIVNLKTFVLTAVSLIAASASAADCKSVPSWKGLKDALTKARRMDNGGLNLEMWGTVVNRDGEICAVVFTGEDRGSQWPGSRAISAQKAYTANAFSLPKLALSTANLYSATQPGGSLFGLQASNPVDARVAYEGDVKHYGQLNDPMVGKKMGGVNVFGGGLALYTKKGVLVGAIGVSGDSACADHNIAWQSRKVLALDHVPAGVSLTKDDDIVYLAAKEIPNGFKHPTCGGKENTISLPSVSKIE